MIGYRLSSVMAAFALVLCGCGRQSVLQSQIHEAWDQLNDPALLGLQTANWQALPQRASLPQASVPWSGYWWPTARGGISLRWQTDPQAATYRAYVLKLPDEAALATMPSWQLNLLSPAEKFDLYLGRTKLPLARAQQQAMLADVVNGEVPDWHGICHAWSASATSERQPGEGVVVGLNDGRSLTFYYSDLEALLMQTYADTARFQKRIVGARCSESDIQVDDQGRATAASCRDVNPATFHLALAAFIGLQGKPLVGDMSGNHQVWNFPLTGYDAKVSNHRKLTSEDPKYKDRAPGTVALVDVDTTVFETAGSGSSLIRPEAVKGVAEFRYTLELDAEDRIIGGEWDNTKDHPDFIWHPVSRPKDGVGIDPAYAAVRRLVDHSLQHPIVVPGFNMPTEGSTEAKAILKLLATKPSSFLVKDAGMSREGAVRLDAYLAGPDAIMGNADDLKVESVQSTTAFISKSDLAALIRYATAHGL